MSFWVPRLPVHIGVWHPPAIFPEPPSQILRAQLATGKRGHLPFAPRPGGAVVPAQMHIFLPALADVRDGKASGGADVVEVPLYSGRFYNVLFVDDLGKGFPNEHRFAYLRGTPAWPLPYPSTSSLAGISVNYFRTGNNFPLGLFPMVLTHNVPFPCLFCVSVVSFLDPLAAIVCNIDGVFTAPSSVSPIVQPANGQAFCYQFFRPVLAGARVCTVTPTALPTYLFGHALGLRNLAGGFVDVAGVAVGVGVPFVAGPLGQVNPIDCYIANFACFGPITNLTLGLGYVNDFIPVATQGVLPGGQLAQQVVGSLVSPAVGIFPANIPMNPTVDYGGQIVAYR